MKRFLLIILSFIFLGGVVSSSAFYINSSLNIADTEICGGGIRTNYMFVSSQSEIEAVNGDLTITFSDLVKDIIKSYGGTNSYFTRDLGSNYNNITCINAVGKETQCFATNFRGVQFTIRFTEYACVD